MLGFYCCPIIDGLFNEIMSLPVISDALYCVAWNFILIKSGGSLTVGTSPHAHNTSGFSE